MLRRAWEGPEEAAAEGFTRELEKPMSDRADAYQSGPRRSGLALAVRRSAELSQPPRGKLPHPSILLSVVYA